MERNKPEVFCDISSMTLDEICQEAEVIANKILKQVRKIETTLYCETESEEDYDQEIQALLHNVSIEIEHHAVDILHLNARFRDLTTVMSDTGCDISW